MVAAPENPRAARARQRRAARIAHHLPLTIRQIFYRLVGAHGYEKIEQLHCRARRTGNGRGVG
jgi:hypothetical protein